MVISVTNLYSPGVTGFKAHTFPALSVPGMAVQSLSESVLVCHFEFSTVYLTPLMVLLLIVMHCLEIREMNLT